MLTFHPQGIHHGPQPGRAARPDARTRTDEIAVMIDTRRPLDVCARAAAFERDDYWKSWQPEP
jgi:homogentisate 1,2-dioxygenase